MNKPIIEHNPADVLDPYLYKYQIGQDVVLLYMHRFGSGPLGMEPDEVRQTLGLDVDTFRKRQRNVHTCAEGKGGLHHTAKMTRRVYALFGHMIRPYDDDPDMEARMEAQLRLWALTILQSYRDGVPL